VPTAIPGAAKGSPVPNVAALAEELRRAGAGMKEAIAVVNADNNANYQSVIRVMDAARQAGFGQVVFAVEQSTKKYAQRAYGGRPAHLSCRSLCRASLVPAEPGIGAAISGKPCLSSFGSPASSALSRGRVAFGATSRSGDRRRKPNGRGTGKPR